MGHVVTKGKHQFKEYFFSSVRTVEISDGFKHKLIQKKSLSNIKTFTVTEVKTMTTSPV